MGVVVIEVDCSSLTALEWLMSGQACPCGLVLYEMSQREPHT